MAITGSINLTSSLAQTPPASIPGGSKLTTQNSIKFVPVTGAPGTQDAIDLKYSRTLTLAATPAVLDLSDLTDVFGEAVAFTRVRTVLIVNRDINDGHNLLIGYSSATTNAWTALVSNPGQITLGASTGTNSGSLFAACPNTTGWAVSSTNRLLNLDPGVNTLVVSIEVTGCSA